METTSLQYRPQSIHSINEAGPPAIVLTLVFGLLAFGFWFFTTEAYAIRVSSGQWWFYLVLCALLLFGASVYVLRAIDHGTVKLLFMIITIVFVIALTTLGIQHRPFRDDNLTRRIGLVPAFTDNDGYEVSESKPGEVYTAVDTVNQENFLPTPLDQGHCGSCWAVASAAALSARYNKMIHDGGGALPDKSIINCTPTGVDMKDWHFSPQYLLDKDTIRGDPSSCSGDSFGKCNGNHQMAGFELAMSGTPNTQCIPYFVSSDSSPNCNKDCGSPETTYLNCPSGTESKQCLQNPGIQWTKCTDDSELKFKAESYSLKHIKGEAAMMKEIDESGPIFCGINFYAKRNGNRAAWTLQDKDNLWGQYSDMVTAGYVVRPSMDGDEYTKEFREGGHALVVYGFGERNGVKYWNCRNSWGPQWGNNGNIKIERGIDAWNIESFCTSAKVRDYTGSG